MADYCAASALPMPWPAARSISGPDRAEDKSRLRRRAPACATSRRWLSDRQDGEDLEFDHQGPHLLRGEPILARSPNYLPARFLTTPTAPRPAMRAIGDDNVSYGDLGSGPSRHDRHREGAPFACAGAGRRAASPGAGTGNALATIRSPRRPLEAGPEVAVPVRRGAVPPACRPAPPIRAKCGRLRAK
jgi:hypothetical protein